MSSENHIDISHFSNLLESDLRGTSSPRSEDDRFISQRSEEALAEYRRMKALDASDESAECSALTTLYDGFINED